MNCYVLVDLNRDKLMHQNLGQRQMYVNYFDRHVKLPDELPTIGILLCHRKTTRWSNSPCHQTRTRELETKG